MEKRTTGLQVLSRRQAVFNAGYHIAEVREWLAELYGWTISGGQDYIAVLVRARNVLENIYRVFGLAAAFATTDGFSDDVNAFFEEARLEAARILAEREARTAEAAGKEVPF
ncbi:hypothetical protein Thermus77420_18320 [Thermus thalpophilus]